MQEIVHLSLGVVVLISGILVHWRHVDVEDEVCSMQMLQIMQCKYVVCHVVEGIGFRT